MATIEEALVTIVTGNAGVASLAASRMYPIALPAGVTLPALAYQRVSAQRQHNLAGPGGLTRVRFQITAIASMYSTAKALANAVRAALDGYRGTVSGVFVQAALSEDERDQSIGDAGAGAEANMTYSTQLDVLVWHSE